MSRSLLRTALVAAALCLSIPFSAEFSCNRYDFALNRYIRLNAKAGDLVVQDVEFLFPSYIGPKKLDIEGRNEAVVDVKNYGSVPLRIHVAIALFDASGNLVGCGTSGSKLGYTRSGESEDFHVAFNYVHSKLMSAKYFYLTVETEPAK